MTTIRLPGGKCAREWRTNSLSLRRTRFLTTAPPTRFEVIIPTFAAPSAVGQKKASLKSRPCTAFPHSRTRAKSRPSRRWADFGNKNRSGFGVAGKMDFDTLREEALASPLAAAVQSGAPGLGRHARAETKLLLARAFGRLVGAFHKK